MSVAIKVKNLSKIYKVYEKDTHRITDMFSKKSYKEFYALKDVSFEIKKGECVGIIGHNGAGKSTLLKILTGVAFQNGGTLEVNGKIASLLELGSGFNPEFTGIENIYFNGGLNGLTTEQIEAAIPEIIKFADIGDFVNRPVKTYSSGMFARLAFATAINIDPDILIVDEILSVGDVKFQVKCMEKFEEFKKKGKTILYVSHGLGTVKKFCDRAIWLDHGTVRDDGNSIIVVERYYSTNFINYITTDKKDFPGNNIENVDLECLTENIDYRSELKLKLKYNIKNTNIENKPNAVIELRTTDGENSEFVTSFSTKNLGETISWQNGENELMFKIKSLNLMSGEYYINVVFEDGEKEIYRKQKVYSFIINDKYRGEGFIIPEHTWS